MQYVYKREWLVLIMKAQKVKIQEEYFPIIERKKKERETEEEKERETEEEKEIEKKNHHENHEKSERKRGKR